MIHNFSEIQIISIKLRTQEILNYESIMTLQPEGDTQH